MSGMLATSRRAKSALADRELVIVSVTGSDLKYGSMASKHDCICEPAL